MTNFHWRMVAAAAFIVITFLGLIGYAMRVAPRMRQGSTLALNTFYTRCRAHDYEGAHQLFTQSLQADISTALVAKEWHNFEVRNGPLKTWKSATGISITGFGGSVCVLPPFVDFRYAVQGVKGTGTLIYVRMVPEDGGWRLQRFNVLR